MNGRRNGGEGRGSSLQWVKRVTMWSVNDSNKEEKKVEQTDGIECWKNLGVAMRSSSWMGWYLNLLYRMSLSRVPTCKA